MRRLSLEACAAGAPALSYRAVGRGRPILFCGGLGARLGGFHAQLTHFCDRYRCLAWEYRGLLREEAPALHGRRSIRDHAADALAILDAEHAERTVVIGWSMGVQVALELFRLSPQRVALLVLVNGGCRSSFGTSPEATPLRRLYPRGFELLRRAPALFERLVRQSVRSPEVFTWARRIGIVGRDFDADLFAEVARPLAEVDGRAWLAMLEEMQRHDASDVLPHVDVPTLVIGGDRDPFTSRAALERLVDGIAGAEYLLLPGAGHYVLLDHAQHVNLRIDKLLSERGY